jgi:hypothetical protein
MYFDAKRPVLLNGIEDYATRGDLVDRCVFLHLPTIPEAKRRTEADYWGAATKDAPLILGALFDAVAGALKALPNVRLATMPRMADFARWGEAVGRALGWKSESFLAAYNANRKNAIEAVLEDSPVTGAVLRFLETTPSWTGTAGDLLGALGQIVGEKTTESKRWPHSPRALSGAIRRLGPALRSTGIEVEFGRDGSKANRRLITITQRPEEEEDRPSESSESSDRTANACGARPCGSVGQDSPEKATVRSDGRPSDDGPTVRTSSDSQVQGPCDVGEPSDGSDDSDGRIPTLSGGRVREVF